MSFSGRIQILEDGSLLIASVRPTDGGEYTCERSNEAGEIKGSAWLAVLVRTQIIQPPADTKERGIFALDFRAFFKTQYFAPKKLNGFPTL